MSDETRPFSPYGDDDDATRVQRPGDPNHPDGDPHSSDAWVFDRTEKQPPHPADPPAGRPGTTSIMPPARDDWGAGSGRGAPWAGRAEVRPPRAGDYSDQDWTTSGPPSEPRGKWWMPILVGIVGLILVGLLSWGIWLIIQSSGNEQPTPSAPTAATTTQAPAVPATQPTAAPPTTQPTTAEPTQSTTIPALRGQPQQDAIAALGRSGLSARLRFRTSSDAAPGTVIDSDPQEGQAVPPRSVVTLIIAVAPTTPPVTPSGDQGQQQPPDNN